MAFACSIARVAAGIANAAANASTDAMIASHASRFSRSARTPSCCAPWDTTLTPKNSSTRTSRLAVESPAFARTTACVAIVDDGSIESSDRLARDDERSHRKPSCHEIQERRERAAKDRHAGTGRVRNPAEVGPLQHLEAGFLERRRVFAE